MLNTFSIPGATHYCSSFKPRAGDAQQSLEEFNVSRLQGRQSIREGTEIFEDFRTCALREAERYLFLATSHYRRALDLMMPGAAHWAHVTLYYGSWFAAHGLMAMLGCSVLNKRVVHVGRSAPGNQELRVQGIGSGSGQYYVPHLGSHQRFWQIFYDTAVSIKSFVDQESAAVMAPIASNSTWLIEQRNKFNYRSTESIALGGRFSRTFVESDFPSCLPGELNTQYRVCEGFLAAAISFADTFGLATDALDILEPPASIRQKIRDKIYRAGIPNLVGSSRYRELFGV